MVQELSHRRYQPETDFYHYIKRFSRPIHIALWVLFFIVLVWMDLGTLDLWTNITSNLSLTLFFAGIVYANILYLIPQFLFRHKTLQYILLLLLCILLITPIFISMRLITFRNYPELADQYYYNIPSVIFLELFVALFSLFYAIIRDWLKKRSEVAELYTTNIETELNFLKTQINPHFLFNSLNSIYALTLKKSDEAPDMVLRLSEIMRYMLYDCNEEVVPLEQEINYLKNYLELEKTRKGQKNEILFEVVGDPSGRYIAPLLLITFVENAFKHGVNNIDKGYVHIRFDIREDHLIFDIENSVSPQIHLPRTTKKSGGIGLENARRRLELIYPGKSSLDISKTRQSFRVKVEIQL